MRHDLMIEIPGKAQGLQRSRQARNGHRFDPKKNSDNKAFISLKAEHKAREEGISIPIPPGFGGYTMSIVVHVKPPKSTTKKVMKLIEEGKVKPKTKPDLDNIVKLYADALVQGGIIEDDKNITSLSSFKRYNTKEDKVACLISWESDEAEEEEDG